MPPVISVVICTHNRAEYLRKSLRSVVKQSFPKDKYEILVIDNASTDTTKEIIELESEKSNKIKYIYEPILGLSQARNTGWLNSNGDYVWKFGTGFVRMTAMIRNFSWTEDVNNNLKDWVDNYILYNHISSKLQILSPGLCIHNYHHALLLLKNQNTA